MTERLAERVVVIVGATSGMGKATAIQFAAAGAHVIAAGRRTERLEELRAAVPGIHTLAVDVRSREQVDELIRFALSLFGRIDILVYATGTNLPGRSLEKLSVDGWNDLLGTNLTGAFHCTQAVLPGMRKQQSGLIIYVSTAAVQRPDLSGVAYQSSKHGLSGLAHGTRVEEQGHGIRTSIVFPGLCETEILTRRPVPTPTDVLEKALQPEDVAAAILFIAQLPPRAVVPELQLLPSQIS